MDPQVLKMIQQLEGFNLMFVPPIEVGSEITYQESAPGIQLRMYGCKCRDVLTFSSRYMSTSTKGYIGICELLN